MNNKLARGSGVGLVVGAMLGILADPLLGSSGITLVLGAAFGIVFGSGVAALSGSSSKAQ
jgi:hypothetical protein